MKKRLIIMLIAGVLLLQGMGAESYTFATYPFGEAENIYSAFSTLTSYLSRETGDQFRLIITRDYNELRERIVEKSVDFAWIGSANYIKTRNASANTVYLATYREWNSEGLRVQPYYQSFILTLKNAPYTDLETMEGTRFAFTSPDSTSGYAYPRMIFDQKGIVPDDYFGTIFFLGRHSNVIKALTAGSIDAGACSDGTYYKAVRDYGDIFRLLAASDPIPLDAIIAMDHVAPEKRGKVLESLLAIGTDHPVNDSIKKHLSWPAAGFEVRSPGFYDSVEEAMAVKKTE